MSGGLGEKDIHTIARDKKHETEKNAINHD